ncbi:MAG: reductive dehalogenase [Candidatus Thorarchaeota archaeon]
MLIIKELCDPGKCNLECIEACIRVRKDKAPMSFSSGDEFPFIAEQGCTVCLACVRACPFDAVTSDIIDPAEDTITIDRLTSDSESPYEVADTFKRFPEADMIFARVGNDPDFENYQHGAYHGAEAMIDRNLPGYGRYEHILSVAGWKLYDSRHNVITDRLRLVDTTPNSAPSDSAELTREVKHAARLYGADLVGVANLDHNWIYSTNRRGEPYEIPESINKAIVIAIEMNYEDIETSPAFASSAATALAYSKMAFVEIELTAFIKRLGYNAIPCGNDIALSVPLAIDAGLGQFGRHGILITKKFGPRVRIAKVLTDMPLNEDSPDLGFCKAVVRFCGVCEKCATTCPSQSIPYGIERTWKGRTKSNNSGVGPKWYINPESCYNFWIENGGDCSNCISSCPYNKKDGILHRMILWVVRYVPRLNRLVVKMDDLLGYGKQKIPRNPLERFD